ncbi:sigma 54-interacting transcriptional regulator [Calidifontibacillus erzurumensis]|uniref:HTH-type transcriptional regulatory protein TyrR n=1 Tax=Calidifontibacillus erzurumensis TaxID=2741433 RepID=A0A8J8KBS1_9BACI|nr:sigma 54-interacting transcriptional regulator [Calidifontibacillus erzurumensis]NSL51907.1 sigma 54-interacting transcriptional regulator [Calidifontibacillus erzurumensis]
MNTQEISTIETKESIFASQPFIAQSLQMKNIVSVIEKVGKVSSTVLIVGESGVGKEQVANAIYRCSKRKGKPFIKINCGAIPESLIESELFGYKKGAFTGADASGKTGYFVQAHQGIIFLDEITELPLNLQVKLLRVLQEKEVTPIGSSTPIPVDVQIIAATNRDLPKLVKEGRFREDLYYRLNVVNIYIPPLRERKDDIPHLVNSFLEMFNRLYHKEVHITKDALELLKDYPWYGNIRELKNCIERMVVIADTSVINTENINLYLPKTTTEENSNIQIYDIIPMKEALEYVEEKLIVMAIEKYKSINAAAKILGLTQPTMSRKYKKIKEKRNKNNPNKIDKSVLIKNELHNHLQSIATVIAASLNIDKIIKLKENLTIENPEYHYLQNKLTKIRVNEGKICWSYIWILDSNNRVINLATDEKLKMVPGEEYIGPPEMMDAIYKGFKGKVSVTPLYTDKYGQYMSSIAPIRDEDQNIIAIVGADFSVDYINKHTKKLMSLLS